jgi:hypothetical protein
LNTNGKAPRPVASAVASAVKKTAAVVTLTTIGRQGGGGIGKTAELGSANYGRWGRYSGES